MSLASPNPWDPLGLLTPEEAERRKKKAIAEMQSAVSAPPPNPQGSIGGLTEQQYRESLARAQAPQNSAKAVHATMDPVGHQLMFGPIAPGRGGVGGGVIDGLQVALGTGGALRAMGLGKTAKAYALSDIANTKTGEVLASMLRSSDPLLRKAVGKAAVGGYKQATGTTPTQQSKNLLFNLASILGP